MKNMWGIILNTRSNAHFHHIFQNAICWPGPVFQYGMAELDINKLTKIGSDMGKENKDTFSQWQFVDWPLYTDTGLIVEHFKEHIISIRNK